MKKIYLLIIVSFILNACSSNKKINATTNASTENQLDVISSDEQKLFLDAIKAYTLGDIPLAVSKLNECVRNNPNNDAAYYQLSKIYIETQKYEPAFLGSRKGSVV